MWFIVEAEAVAAHGNDVVVIVQLCQTIAQAAHQGVDCLFGDAQAIGARPDDLHDGVTAANGAFGVIGTGPGRAAGLVLCR